MLPTLNKRLMHTSSPSKVWGLWAGREEVFTFLMAVTKYLTSNSRKERSILAHSSSVQSIMAEMWLQSVSAGHMASTVLKQR